MSERLTKSTIRIGTKDDQVHPTFIFYFIFFNFYVFIYLFLVALGLRCCVRAFSSCSKTGLLFVAVCGLLLVVASLVEEHRL